MRINRITLNNFGSYEGENVFDTLYQQDKNIVVIGGKNGTGKTTLFNAIRICLYGHMSMGYKQAGSYYFRAVNKMINHTAKLERPAYAGITLELELNNGQGLDQYRLIRQWIVEEGIAEQFIIGKNGIALSEGEIADFQKYLLNTIPPELFNLYFFDGEKISNFFLEEGSNARIKEAFLTICGYDVFSIMQKNFKRLHSSMSANTKTIMDGYLSAKEKMEAAKQNLQELEKQLAETVQQITDVDAELVAVERDYQNIGGITQDEWNAMLEVLRVEDKRREQVNAWLKNAANDILPFLILKKELFALSEQVKQEEKNNKFQNFCEILRHPEVDGILVSQSADLRKILEAEAKKQFGSDAETILGLSFEQSVRVHGQIDDKLSLREDELKEAKRTIQQSLKCTAETRQKMEDSDLSMVNRYMERKAALYEQKSELLQRQIEQETALHKAEELASDAISEYERKKAQAETEIKKQSINDISAKAILMLEDLQEQLYHNQIMKLENIFQNEIDTLMRKIHFIDDICIDDDFTIHLYQDKQMDVHVLWQLFATNDCRSVSSVLGLKGFQTICHQANTSNCGLIQEYLKNLDVDYIKLPVELDKSSLSNGEKQIFIMAFYHALIQLSKREIPFIIDTPFARIDTEHRANIVEHFFKNLKGQVFILSTNEEINAEHLQSMKEKIAATYLLDNTDGKRTTVVKNVYFGGELA